MQIIKTFIKFLNICMITCGLVTIITGTHQQQQQHTYKNESQFNQNASNCCNNSSCTTHRVEVQFTTQIIQNEYIVAFDGYYTAKSREDFLKAALNGSKVINDTNTSILHYTFYFRIF